MKKMLLKTSLLASCLTMLSAPVMANDGYFGTDLTLSDQSVNLGLYSLREGATEITTLGADYYFNSSDDKMADVYGEISRKGITGNENLELGLRGKLFYASQNANKQDGQAVMLGVSGRYWFPTEMPVSLSGNFLYAPEIISFGDAKGGVEYNVRGEVQALPSVVAYVGYRSLTVDFKNSRNYGMDNSFNVGVNIAFQ